MESKLMRPALLALLVAAGLAGCASYTPPPKLDLPTPEGVTAPAELGQWWQSLNAPVLNGLIDEALRHNTDVLVAMESVGQSRATLRQAQVALLPDVNATLNATRRNPSDLTGQPGRTGASTSYTGGLSVSYEIDLWGRVWKAKDAALANLLASQYAREATRSAVAAQTARSYFTLLAADAEIALLTQTLNTRNEAVSLEQKRFKAGAIGEYELKLSEAEQASIAAALPQVLAAREKAEAALAVLLGRSPKEIIEGHIERGNGLTVLAEAPEIPAGLPADLLTRRPDVRRAEAQLAVADASLAETRRRYFPNLTLTGFLGGESPSLSDLFNAPARTWNIAGQLLQPIVGMANIDAQVEAAKASRNQAELAYAQAARSAYADVRSALAAHSAARDTLVATETRVKAQTKVKELADIRYKAGVSSYLDQLNAERDRLGAERDRVSALQGRLNALVDVYQSLGGGWQQQDIASTK
ncbi:efflux transporter outer membrane subunit [Chitinimonas sp. PSY-7]|uniref:efflux transporter outer membrane subunit n=1 Tax=Chitinimonas sp. PSY-7 TaxID=3459088 RepID=UPI0040401AF8